MRYALYPAEDGRILSVTYEEYAAEGMPIVEQLPEGDITEYRYVGGKFLHEPLPKPEIPEPEATTDDVVNILLGVSV